MIYRTPTYCRDFRCIAGECKDSCCKGWEIDIDAETAEYYSRVDGEFGERLRSSIKNGSFVLTEDERCPFLNMEGLCDIYTELGEENLCRICSDHPRYFEWFGTVKEGGTGLCCEAAAELILSRPFALCEEEIPFEEAAGSYDEELFSLAYNAREEMFGILCSEDMPLSEAVCRCLDIAVEIQQSIDVPCPEAAGTANSSHALREIFGCLYSLEPIDENWQPYIKSRMDILGSAQHVSRDYEPYLRRLMLYFLFRYLLKSVYDGGILGYTKFAALSIIVIGTLYRLDGCSSLKSCAETAKNYSKETEYSEENMAELLEDFGKEPFFSTASLKVLAETAFAENMDEI